MPEIQSASHDYLSVTPANLRFFLQNELTTNDVNGGIVLKPRYETILRERLGSIGVNIQPRSTTALGRPQAFQVYTNSQHIGDIVLQQEDDDIDQPRHFAISTLLHRRRAGQPSQNIDAIRNVGIEIDNFANEINEMIKEEKLGTVVKNKASVNLIKNKLNNVDVSNIIGTNAGIIPNVKGVNIGQGRKRKTRKHRLRKIKKTRKH